jgi:hypothetical protein
MNHAPIEVEVRLLQTKDLANAQPRHCGDCEHGAVRLRSDRNDLPRLFSVEESGRIAKLIAGQRQLASHDRLRTVTPRPRRADHRAQSAEDIWHGFAGYLLRKQCDEVLLELSCEFVEKNFPQVFSDVGAKVRFDSLNVGRLLVREHLRPPDVCELFHRDGITGSVIEGIDSGKDRSSSR